MNLSAGIADDSNNHHQQQQSLLLQPPHRPPPSNCHLHPDEVVTGFCASCLRDRLTALEPSSVNSSARRKSTSSAVRSLFSRATTAAAAAAASSFNAKVDNNSNRNNYSSAAELRRSKSFSAAHRQDFLFPSSFEPQRHSCDIRGRSTLYALFHQDDSARIASAVAAPQRAIGHEPSSATVSEKDDEDEIRAAEPEPDITDVRNSIGGGDEEVPAGAASIFGEEEAKPMKEHIGVESLSKKPTAPLQRDFKEIAGSFWVAASVFSKKLQKWRRKQKLKKEHHCSKNNNNAANFTQAEMPQSSRRFTYAQSEVSVNVAGRRSCDIAPRFSLDAGRMSFDEPRFSWDEPRASWDGHLIGSGRSACPRLLPMLSVVEDDPAPQIIQRSDGQIPVEEDSMIPGGTSQTRDYYLDSSSQRRRRSLDRSNSSRRLPLELDNNEPKPAVASSELFSSCYNGDDRSESFESVYRDSQKPSANSSKKSKRWSIWGFIHWRSGGGRGGGRREPNVVERSFSESWPELRRNGINGNLLRCNSNVSSRHSFSSSNSGFGSMRCRHMDINGNGRKMRDELVLERNRSCRYSPKDIDNGLLRFYLTPMRGNRRNGAPSVGKNSYKSSESFARTMLRMY